MRLLILLTSLVLSFPAVAADDPYVELTKQVQEKLRAQGLYSGPISGEIGFNTQAAIAQFQLSRALPASGALDDTTLAALGLQPAQGSEQAGAGTPRVDPQASNARRCDDLMGQEKEQCLQQGGTVEASAQSASGASGPAR